MAAPPKAKAYMFTRWLPGERACDHWYAHFLGKGIPVGLVCRTTKNGGVYFYGVWIRLGKGNGCKPSKRRENHSLVRSGNGFEEIWKTLEIFKGDALDTDRRIHRAATTRAIPAASISVARGV